MKKEELISTMLNKWMDILYQLEWTGNDIDIICYKSELENIHEGMNKLNIRWHPSDKVPSTNEIKNKLNSMFIRCIELYNKYDDEYERICISTGALEVSLKWNLKDDESILSNDDRIIIEVKFVPVHVSSDL